MPTPFRWNVTRREQLGRLVDVELDTGYYCSFAGLVDQTRSCVARVIAMAGNSRLVFIGRSPENLYDYLTGALSDTSWADRLRLLNVSLKRVGDGGEPDSVAYAALRDHFRAIGIDPLGIATGTHPVALVDMIYGGETFGKITDFLLAWALDERVDARAVFRRLRIVGITEAYVRRPKTWRWRRLDWAHAYRPSALRGVAVPYWFWSYLADSQKKVSQANPPERWADPEMARPPRGPEYASALRLASALHELGRSRVEREELAGEIAAQHAMREPWCRALTSELRSKARRKRVGYTLASKRLARSRNSRYLPS